jgi:hypothetical protein
MIDYLDDGEIAYLEYSKYYDGMLEEFIKSRFELVNNYDIPYFAPCGLINYDDDHIIFAT